MRKGRLEAFSDGVIAIILTIMVLELKVPQGVQWSALRPLVPVFMSYALSFIFIGIYWNNHHHMMHAAEKVNGRILWANLHLLFWLSLIPFVTAWMGENHLAAVPVALYGIDLFLAAVAYYVLAHALVVLHGPGSRLAVAFGKDYKGKVSLVIYALGIFLCFWSPRLACGMYVLVAAVWFIPDRRIEKVLVD